MTRRAREAVARHDADGRLARLARRAGGRLGRLCAHGERDDGRDEAAPKPLRQGMHALLERALVLRRRWHHRHRYHVHCRAPAGLEEEERGDECAGTERPEVWPHCVRCLGARRLGAAHTAPDAGPAWRRTATCSKSQQVHMLTWFGGEYNKDGARKASRQVGRPGGVHTCTASGKGAVGGLATRVHARADHRVPSLHSGRATVPHPESPTNGSEQLLQSPEPMCVPARARLTFTRLHSPRASPPRAAWRHGLPRRRRAWPLAHHELRRTSGSVSNSASL